MQQLVEEFVRIGAAGTPVFSTDGGTLFHLRGAGVPQVWALDLASGADRQLTDDGEKVAVLRRFPKDDRLIYGTDRGGDERQQLVLLDPAAGDMQALTDAPGVIHDFGAIAPDGVSIAFAANDRDEAHFDILVQSLSDGARRRVFHGTGVVSAGAFSPDGTRLIVIADRGFTDHSLLVIDLAAGTAREFPRLGSTRYQSVRWTSDGAALMGLTDHVGAEFIYLARFDLASGAVDCVYGAPGRDVEAWALSADGKRLATVENDRGYSLLRLGAADAYREPVSLPEGLVSEPGFDPAGARLAVSVSTPTEPPAIWLVDADTLAASPVHAPDARDGAVAPSLVAWRGDDGREIPGWMFLPAGPRPAAGLPAIIWVHGGPEMQARGNFRPDIQLLLAQGYAVLMPNVRGSTGYGREYAAADDREKRLDAVADLAQARHFLAAQPGIDAARIGVMGQSYGGFMVLSAITEYPDLWRAAVNFYGIADFTTLLQTTGPWRRDQRAHEYGRDAALFARISPIHRADRITAPLLVLHGHRDPRVPISESEQIVETLRAGQHRVRYETFDYAGHGFIRPEDRLRAWGAVAEFFREHL